MADAISYTSIALSQALCSDFESASSLEWLETNHTGAFAMGTVAGVNTRRYHGLLIASLHPPSDRYSMFSRVDEEVAFAHGAFSLSTAQYPGLVHPDGYKYIDSFSASPHACWTYRKDGFELQKTIRLVEGRQSVLLAYKSNQQCMLRIRLFVSCRDYHNLSTQNPSLNPHLSQDASRLTIRPYDHLPPLHFHHNARTFEADGVWFNNFEYLRELDRGLDYREDLYSPGVLHFSLSPETDALLVGSIEEEASLFPAASQTFANPLVRALDQFRVTRADKKPTLLAGYPWFTDWSRDTLISLPALIASGFPASETKDTLEFLLAERQQGILPNRFTDKGSSPEYNTVDASLWFFVAAHHYMQDTHDVAFLNSTLFPAALDIIDWHLRGTFYGIGADPVDHLLFAGEQGIQLTWMDAKIGDFVVTPRIGKPVEINALWYNALRISCHWAELLAKTADARHLLQLADQVYASYSNFWNADRNSFYDVLTPSGPDASIRPNQLLALSLPYPLVGREKAQMVVELVKETLLTPAGLRTLEPSDQHYRPRFDGDMRSRDSAYHQGTVWPWLFSPFIQAYLYAYNYSPAAKSYCTQLIDSAMHLMSDCCIGSIAEVYDAEPPQTPGGCPAQLWSVAQLILATQTLTKGGG